MVRERMEITAVEKEKLKYPRSIAFIISNEFCERFNFYGMRTILVLYLTHKLSYDDDFATVLFHIFTSFVYFCPIFGAIIADSWLGKFKTILYLSIVYAIGSTVISVGAIPTLPVSAQITAVVGLLLISIGTGGIKPCVSAFGGDQFRLPEQAAQLATFFSLFYFAINAGSLISTTLTPILREDVHCFGEKDCYSLAFGVPGMLMIVSVVIFIAGRPLYTVKKPGGNMILEVLKCISHALRNKCQDSKRQKREHWLDYAQPKYSNQLISDIKSLFSVLVLFLPIPIFWALFDQQGSRWTFQATRMTGELGVYTIKPDQMQVVNPLLILAFIPIFQTCLYPVLAKLGISTPLRKLGMGGILAGVSFVISGLVELKLEKGYPVLPGPQEAQLRIYNGMPCDYRVFSNLSLHMNFSIRSLEAFEEKHVRIIPEHQNYHVDLESTDDRCPKFAGLEITLDRSKATSFLITQDGKEVGLRRFEDNPGKPKKGNPSVRVLVNRPTSSSDVKLQHTSTDETFVFNSTDAQEVPVGEYRLWAGTEVLKTVNLKLGGSYRYVVGENFDGKAQASGEFVMAEPNSMHMMWLLPQYVVMTAAEVMFSVTGLEFSFTQAPESMKSVLTAAWLLTVAVGNVIVAVVAETKAFDSQAYEFFLFAILMALDMGVFMYLAVRYKYVEHKPVEEPALQLPNTLESGLKTINLEREQGDKDQGVDNSAFEKTEEP